MAYNNGFPMSYQQMYPQYVASSFQPQMTQQQPQMMQQPVNDSGILWVQGEAGAKSWAVAPGKSVMLMDSESNTFYIKSSDQSGMPMPLRIFDYTERTATQQMQPQAAPQHTDIDVSQFVTKEELNEKLDELFAKKEYRREKVDG